jgi:uncharacterized protein YukE
MKYESLLVLFTAAVLWVGCNPTHDDAYLPPEDPATSPQAAPDQRQVATPAPATNDIQVTSPQLKPGDPQVAETRDPSDESFTVQKQTTIATVERSMEKIDARLESVVTSVRQLDQEAQTEVMPVLETLRDQREELDALVERMRADSGEAWQELQRDFQAAYRSFVDALEETEELLRG